MTTQTKPELIAGPPTARRSRARYIILGGLAVLLLAAGAYALMMIRMSDANTPPPGLDTSRTRLSANGLYRGTITPGLDPVTINTLHSWTLHLESAAGQPVDDATIAVQGDMPGHGHGLPTRPVVGKAAGPGDYLIEGMKFQMPGWWYVQFAISGGTGADTLRFDFILK